MHNSEKDAKPHTKRMHKKKGEKLIPLIGLIPCEGIDLIP